MLLAVVVVLFAACGGGGGGSDTTTPPPTGPAVPTITHGEIVGGLISVTFCSPLLINQPPTEPAKVVGLMDEAVQIDNIQKVCWEGDLAGWGGQQNYCTGNIRDGNYFCGTLNIPAGDEGNLVAHLNPAAVLGAVSWFNLSKWEVPGDTILNIGEGKRGTVKFPSQ